MSVVLEKSLDRKTLRMRGKSLREMFNPLLFSISSVCVLRGVRVNVRTCSFMLECSRYLYSEYLRIASANSFVADCISLEK